ncbi:ATP-binding protein [Desulfotignum phosphitoxidans]|nr:ATP-binding protein [Desulfotignum phosphitoxidans]
MTEPPGMRFDCDARDDIAIPDKCRILIVEDEILIAEDIRKSLARLGYCVTEMVTSGKKALDSIQAAPPHVVLMDITLKGKMTGIETAQKIKDLWHIPVIYTTASEDEATVALAARSNPVAYLIKPIDIRELKAAIELAACRAQMEKRLREANESLERKVSERTRKLREINRQLTKEIQGHQATQAELIKARQRLEDAQKIACLGHWEWEVSTRTVVWSKEVFRICQKDPNVFEPSYEAFLEMLFPEERDRARKGIAQAWRKKEPYEIRHGIVRPDGSIRTVLQKGRVQLDSSGTPTGMLGTVQDITDQYEIEQKIRRKVSELSVFNQLVRSGVGQQDVGATLKIIFSQLFDFIKPDLVIIYFIKNNRLVFQGKSGNDNLVSFPASATLKMGECLCGQVVSRRSPVFSLDIHSDSRCVLSHCKNAGITSFAGLPLKAGEKLIGVLGLGSVSKRNFFGEKAFLTAFANQAGVIIQNTLLKERVNNQVTVLRNQIRRIKKGEDLVRKNKALVQSVVDGIPEPLILIDHQWKIELLNRAAAMYLDVSPQEIAGKKTLPGVLMEKGYPDPTQTIKIDNMGRSVSFETSGWINSDRIKKISFHPVREEASDAPMLILHIKDITEKKQLEKQMVQKEKLGALGQLAAGVAHEINNPIMGIINYAQIIIDDNCKNELHIQILQKIMKEGRRIAGIVKSLLSFARPVSEEKYAPVEIKPILNDIKSLVNSQIHKHSIVFEVVVNDSLPPVLGNAQELQQVFLNFVTNSIYAIQKKEALDKEPGRITITGDTVSSPAGQRVRITFHDNGIGIPRNLIDKIYDPFFTTKPPEQGTGLGLSITHGIVKNHGGTIAVESRKGRYTRFTIFLPVALLSADSE